MKIRQIRIENFGKLSGFSLDLTEGINNLVEENGWGKSTLAAFIRVMFYGFENEGVKKDAEFKNERKRFKPWDGGTFGGSIVFETEENNREYKLVRIFGSSEKDDTFELYDNKTSLPSSDFSSLIGEELFSLDSDSFKKTVFISQNDIATESTGSINAKLGNLSSATDDIDSFSKVDEMLKNKLNSISSTRKTGEIYAKKAEKSGLESDVRRIPALDRSIEIKEAQIKELNRLLSAAEEEAADLNRELEDASRAAALLSKKTHYEGILEREAKKLEEKKLAEKRFPLEAPKEEELLQCIELSKELETAEREVLVYKPDEEEERILSVRRSDFESQLPEEEILNQMSSSAKELSSLEKDYVIYRTLKTASDIRRPVSALWIVLLVIGIVFAVLGGAGIALSYMNPLYKAPGITGLALGAVLAVFGILVKVLGNNSGSRKKSEPDEKGPDYERMAERIDELKASLDSFLVPYERIIGSEYDYLTKLNTLSYEAKHYRQALEKNEKYGKAESKASALKRPLENYVRGLGFEPGENLGDCLEEIRDLLDDVSEAEEDLKEVLAEKAAFEKSCDISEVMQAKEDGKKELSGISEKIRELDDREDEIKGSIASCTAQYDELLKEKDELEAEKERLSDITEEISALSEKERLMGLTREFLSKAKTGFVSKYSAPVAEGFKKYYQTIDGSKGDNYSFDANMKLLIEDHGTYKNLQLYSAGSRDKISLCFRLGLIDAMFKKEKPVIIMDDPFTNLDKKHLEGGKELLAKLKEDYQILYLTCHESRKIKEN